MVIMILKIYLILFSLLYLPVAFSAQTLADLYEQSRGAVVILENIKSSKIKKADKETGELKETSVNKRRDGSGFLIAETLILTSAHIVHGVDELQAVFYDGEKIPATVISSDVNADLSLVKLAYKHPHIEPLLLGDSDKSRIGDDIYTIGAPYSIPFTLTRGIISGRHEKGYQADIAKSEFFQTDAALNPGNSGGPVFNMQGKVIGIVSFIRSKSGGNEGLGFAVTINSAKKLMLEKPPFYSGMDAIVINGAIAKALNTPQSGGVLVTNVARGTMAEKMGLKGGFLPIMIGETKLSIGGDIILSINGISTVGAKNLKKVEQILHKYGNQGKFKLTVLREGKTKELSWDGVMQDK
jgi:S1-C subfamily serine protease